MTAPNSARGAGSAYLVAPPDGNGGPAVLVLHAWWGLTPFFRGVCDRLADAGFVALAPDLNGGQVAATPDEAEALLHASDPNEAAALVVSSASTLRGLPMTPDAPIGVLGFSMGASWGLWLSARASDDIAATVAFYGAQDVDFVSATSAYLGHFAEHDEFVSDDELVLMESHLRLLGRDVDFHRYAGTGHWFFEDDRPAAYDQSAAQLAWDRTITFLHRHLRTD